MLALVLLFIGAVARAQSPEDYAPTTAVQCPDVSTSPLLRTFTPSSQSLHPEELAYISGRRTNVIPQQWSSWLGDGSGIGYNLSAFTPALPNVSLAFSGGGYRAAQYAAGVVSAFDARNSSSKSAGTGGLLQVASYLSGLSGGSWFLGSLYLNDFPVIPDLVWGNNNDLNGWLLDLELIAPGGFNVLNDNNQDFYDNLSDGVQAKANKSFDVSITDIWARALSYHFLNGTSRDNFFDTDLTHGAGQLWSGIPGLSAFRQQEVPFPLVVTVSRQSNTTLNSSASLQDIQYEISPYEFGSWDPALSAMMNLSYAGTPLVSGRPPNNTACVTGFDEAGFMIGTSSSLFDGLINGAPTFLSASGLDANGAVLTILLDVAKDIFEPIHQDMNDLSRWPNPFQNISRGTFAETDEPYLNLDDGGSAGENIPLGPLFLKERGMDFVVAVEASADTAQAWPNGTSLVETSTRLTSILNQTHQPFPPIPSSQSDFLSTGTNRRPTLFGCDPTQNPPEWPLVLYLPNSPPVDGSDPVSNTGTFTLEYSTQHTGLFLDQVHNNTVAGFVPNQTGADSNWPRCVQCAAIDRARFKTSPVTPRSQFCQTCFTQYCYNSSSPPSQSELPGRKFDLVTPDDNSGAREMKAGAGLAILVAAGVGITLGL
ncbi:phospholipase B [Peniophora sp. CONT]|nr:phospholipase B [Peniophora sp. CONT]